MRRKNTKPIIDIINGQRYVSQYWVVNNCLPIKFLRKVISQGEVRTVKQQGKSNRVLISLDDVLNIKKKLTQVGNQLGSYYSIDELAQVLGVTVQQAKHIYYRFKDTLIFAKRRYVSRVEVDQYIVEMATLKENYYSLKEVQKLISYSKSALQKISKERFPGAIVVKAALFSGGEFVRMLTWYPKAEVDAFIERNCLGPEYLTPVEALKKYRLGHIQHEFYMAARSFHNTKILDGARGLFRVHEKDVEEFKRQYAQRILENKYKRYQQKSEAGAISTTTDPEIAYGRFLEKCADLIGKSQYSETVNTYLYFAYDQFNGSNRKDLFDLVSAHRCTLNWLLQCIVKEVFLLDDGEVQILIAKLPISWAKNIIKFLQYCKKNYPEKCMFKTIPERRTENRNSEAQESIGDNIFIQIYLYVSDISKRLPLAIYIPKQAQLWVYVLLHMFEAWRNADVLDIPNIELEQIGVFRLEFFHSSELTNTQSRHVVNQYYFYHLIVNKTGAVNAFNVPNSLIRPLATALVIAEIHRRNCNQGKLMFAFDSSPSPKDFDIFFRDNKALAVFRNLKVCRTLISLFSEYLESIPEAQKEANELTGMLRGHTSESVNTLTVSQTTTIYTNEPNKSKRNHYSKQMFDRGIFGWSYFMTLKIALQGKHFQKLSSEDVTNLIIVMKDKQSPLQLEGLGKFMLERDEKRIAFANEIRRMPKSELHTKLQKLFAGLMPARVPEAQCFRYGNCSYPKPEIKCRQCVYLMPNIYFLISLSDCIDETIKDIKSICASEKIEFCELEADINKKWSILLEYIALLGDACNDVYGLGYETVNTFIKVDVVKKKLSDIDKIKNNRLSLMNVKEI